MISKYHRTLPGNSTATDIYDILEAYDVTSPSIAHAIKKLLLPGQRGAKTRLEDLREARQSIERAIAQQIRLDTKPTTAPKCCRSTTL